MTTETAQENVTHLAPSLEPAMAARGRQDFGGHAGKAGTTVQVLGMDPYLDIKFVQGHNLLEAMIAGTPIIPMYGGRSKPPAVGNLGGGMEPDELERFEKNEPELYRYYESLGTLSPAEMAIIGCARREAIDEGGFDDLEIMLNEDTNKLIILTDYHYKEGHRVLTVWGKYGSYNERDRKEKDEIDYVDWVDFSLPMFDVYKRLRREINGKFPVYPYWSHLRRIGLGLPVIDRYRRDREERYQPLDRMLHDSYRTPFRVGGGDGRFPRYGYQISPEDWYHMFDIVMEKGIEDLTNDVLLYEFNGRAKTKVLHYKPNGKYELKERSRDLGLASKIAFAREYQERKLEEKERSSGTVDADVTAGETTNLAGSEDYTGVSITAEVLKAEEDEYMRRRQEAEDEKYSRWLKP